MIKLIKYEFRKCRTSLIVMLSIAAALFLLAPIGKWLEKDALLYVSVVLLAIYAAASYAFVLVRGITAYSHELRDRSGYLLFMIPRSAASILFSKLLFTVFFAIVMLGASALACMGSGAILLNVNYELEGLVKTLDFVLMQMHMSLAQLGRLALAMVVTVLSNVLVLVSAGYLSTTLSATIIKARRARGVAFVLIYLAIAAGLFVLTDAVQGELDPTLFKSAGSFVRACLPTVLIDLPLTALFMSVSALLLKKKVAV